MNTKILMSVLVIGLTTMAVGGAMTGAFFSDVETSEDNTFTAGTLDLTFGGGAETTDVTIGDIAPGSEDKKILNLKNGGSIDGYLKNIVFSGLENKEKTCNEPEKEKEGATCGDEGELAGNLHLKIYIDDVEDGNFVGGDDTVVYTGMANNIESEVTVNDELKGGNVKQLRVEWSVANDVGNEIQTDQVVFDMKFSLSQE